MKLEQVKKLAKIAAELQTLVNELKVEKSMNRADVDSEFLAVEKKYGTQARTLVETLALFGVDAKVMRVEKGPVVDRVVFTIPPGTRYSEVTSAKDNLMGALRTPGVRIEAPAWGEDALAAEIPHEQSHRKDIELRSILKKSSVPKGCTLPLFIGKSSVGENLVEDLSALPHLLIGGATGQGKTVLLNSIICGLVATYSPDEVQFILYDEKMVEYVAYAGLPHLVEPVITDCRKFVHAMYWVAAEMEKRLKMFARAGQRSIVGYNQCAKKKVPYIVVIADEIDAAIMKAGKEILPVIARVSAMARAAGIHLILATQRPDAKVVSGTLKANIPGRIAFKMATSIDSRTILDETGADDLIGRGDMLFRRKNGQIVRAQGAITRDEDIVELVKKATRKYKKREPKISIAAGLLAELSPSTSKPPSDEKDCDMAIEVIRKTQRASTSHFQRQLGWGYNHAAKILDMLEERGIVGPQVGAGPREILQLPKMSKRKRRK